MIAPLGACALSLVIAGGADVRYVESTLEFGGLILDERFVDWREDGRPDLCVALRLAGGRRELRFFEVTERGLDPDPARVVPVLEDVIAYGFADVREEPGRELLFLTRTGAWSYSLRREGLRGNIERLVEDALLYDVPDDRALPFWSYVLPAAGGDRVLLPGSEAYKIWGPRAGHEELGARAARYRVESDFDAARRTERGDEGRELSAGREGLEVRFESSGFWIEPDEAGGTLLSDSKFCRAPALVDVNADGELDLVSARHGTLRVHLSAGGRVPEEPTRVEEYPDYLDVTDADLTLEFEDLDGDGRVDLLVTIEEEIDGFENGEKRLLCLVNDGERLLPDAPSQVLRFEAAVLRASVVDVDGDGERDLVLRKFDLPSMLGTVTGLEFRLSHLVFFAAESGSALFERRPSMKQVQVFDENTVGDAIQRRVLEFDCSGDGIPDLVEVDLQGRIVIRRLTLDSGFFSGDTWSLDEHPWQRFETRGEALAFELSDVNGDLLGDVLAPRERSLTLFLSQRTR